MTSVNRWKETSSNPRWGDEDYEDESVGTVAQPPSALPGPRGGGSAVPKKTVLHNKQAAERRNRMAKFGSANGSYSHPQNESIEFTWSVHTQKSLSEQIKRDLATSASKATVPHSSWDDLRRRNIVDGNGMIECRAPGGMTMSGSFFGLRQRDDPISIRVSNLSEDVTDIALKELFQRYGSINRLYLAVDKVTMRNKGFAFISYEDKESAELAMKMLQGYGFHHLILQLEWSKGSSRP